MGLNMKAGEPHLPAALGCGCWQARPRVERDNCGAGRSSQTLCSRAHAPAAMALLEDSNGGDVNFLTLHADPWIAVTVAIFTSTAPEAVS